MNQALPLQNAITPTDRLGMTLFLAAVVHAIIILGVSFTSELTRPPQLKTPSVEIRLVHQRSEKAPEEALYLAQANLEGGGNLDHDQSPKSPAFVPLDPKQPGMDREIRMPASAPEVRPRQDIKPLTANKSDQKTPNTEIAPETQHQPLTADQLIASSMEIASLSAEISQSMQQYAQRGKHRHIISAQSMEYRDAAYLDAWRAKVERIGNLNYPDEAKRGNISGRLLLDVAINADGTLNNVTLLKSSGSKVLDNAAMRIVRLAAPFAEFSPEMRTDTDVLHITRTWEFLDSQLSANH
ncbi:MAG: energy transducer TonB [Chromatiales bacterium]|jgi:protein TonB|nr:energy transducer TonB [Chromatiales bacterium]